MRHFSEHLARTSGAFQVGGFVFLQHFEHLSLMLVVVFLLQTFCSCNVNNLDFAVVLLHDTLIFLLLQHFPRRLKSLFIVIIISSLPADKFILWHLCYLDLAIDIQYPTNTKPQILTYHKMIPQNDLLFPLCSLFHDIFRTYNVLRYFISSDFLLGSFKCQEQSRSCCTVFHKHRTSNSNLSTR